MAFKYPTHIEPAPLPNGGKGGFLQVAANPKKQVHDAQRDALIAKHKAEMVALEHKQKQELKPKKNGK